MIALKKSLLLFTLLLFGIAEIAAQQLKNIESKHDTISVNTSKKKSSSSLRRQMEIRRALLMKQTKADTIKNK